MLQNTLEHRESTDLCTRKAAFTTLSATFLSPSQESLTDSSFTEVATSFSSLATALDQRGRFLDWTVDDIPPRQIISMSLVFEEDSDQTACRFKRSQAEGGLIFASYDNLCLGDAHGYISGNLHSQ
ncbi:uncharacterized protein FIBRA_03926 [Fibroporia radiculosa]|uniref:Uncharacterized protein n=1 Tax=Fibroporia radiculosa TaxID=599839 RepID=J4GNR6_9APHY|nr:uncharacterized protein FIBRA_03926 [Fibroporia radiculosa]CCM01855.1 predicted protein [Fibroporia radiculosa]